MGRTRWLLTVLLLLWPAAAPARQAVEPPTRGEAVLAPLRFAPAGYLHGRTHDPAHLTQQPRGRYTRRGFVIGGIAGAVVGLGIGTFIALFCEAEGDGCPNAIPAVTLLGAASGAVGGAIIGAAIPRGQPAPPAPAAPTPPERRRIGSAAVAAGWADVRLEDESTGEAAGGGGLALRASLLAELGPRLALGPEVGHASFGGAGDVRHAALLVRGSWPAGEVSPYVSLNLGAYDATAPSVEFLGGGAGVGLRMTPLRGDRLVIDAEGRWSRHAQNIAPMRTRSVTLGIGLRW